MWAKWAPPLERSRLATTSFCGEGCIFVFLPNCCRCERGICWRCLIFRSTSCNPAGSVHRFKREEFSSDHYHGNLRIQTLLTLSINEHGSHVSSEEASSFIPLNEAPHCRWPQALSCSVLHSYWVSHTIVNTLAPLSQGLSRMSFFFFKLT